MVFYGPNFSLMFLIHLFLYAMFKLVFTKSNMSDKKHSSFLWTWLFLWKRSGHIFLTLTSVYIEAGCCVSTDLCNALYSFLSLIVLNKYNFYKTYNNSILLRFKTSADPGSYSGLNNFIDFVSMKFEFQRYAYQYGPVCFFQ